MQLTETIKLYLTREQQTLFTWMMSEFVRTVNGLVALHLSGTSIEKYTTKMVDVNLPSKVKSPGIRRAQSIVKNYEKELKKSEWRKEKGFENVKEPTVPVLRNLYFGVETNNFKFNGDNLEVPVRENGKVGRIPIKTAITERQKKLLGGAKLGELRILRKGRDFVAQVPYEVELQEAIKDGNVMGIDLGVKCPAVAYFSNGKVKFYGNGFQNRYVRCDFDETRRNLQKKKHLKVVKRIGDKESRFMKNIDHHISRGIVNDAIANNVMIIKFESLKDIHKRQDAFRKRLPKKIARKLNRKLHSWSYYRVINYVKYKAERVGIKVVFVKAAYTSQRCPKCGHIHEANDRSYVCQCGFRVHRDLLGAINICNSTEIIEEKKRRIAKKKKDAEPELATA